MTRSLSVAYLKSHLSAVLGSVSGRGDRVVIRKRGKAVATLVPVDAVLADTPNGFLALVGRFADAPELANELAKVVKERRHQKPGRAIRLRR
jgi:antitoxin (DNA-binding transcriptional repressor) of toxin-antitoxin stability system